MVHHTEWDRERDKQGGFMQGDHDTMEQIIKEMAPGGKHYHAFKDGSVKSDKVILAEGAGAKVVHTGKDYDHSLPSWYHGEWYTSSHLLLMSFVRLFMFILFGFVGIKLISMASKSIQLKRSKSKAKSKSRSSYRSR